MTATRRSDDDASGGDGAPITRRTLREWIDIILVVGATISGAFLIRYEVLRRMDGLSATQAAQLIELRSINNTLEKFILTQKDRDEHQDARTEAVLNRQIDVLGRLKSIEDRCPPPTGGRR